jgi:hypothetical protein
MNLERTVAIYIEMPAGGILVSEEGISSTSEGAWLYRPKELPGELFGTDGVVIKYINRTT